LEKIHKQESFPSSGIEDFSTKINRTEHRPEGARISEKMLQRERIKTVSFTSEKRRAQWKSTDEGLPHVSGGKNRMSASQDSTLTKMATHGTHLVLDSDTTNLLNPAERLEISEEYKAMRNCMQ
jgi:hypothetical protein